MTDDYKIVTSKAVWQHYIPYCQFFIRVHYSLSEIISIVHKLTNSKTVNEYPDTYNIMYSLCMMLCHLI